MDKKAIFIMGPTAAGKTSAAISLSKKHDVALISVDASMIYKDMNIGTNKPTLEEQLVAPHALIDILDPNDSYSAASFCNDAITLMEQAHRDGKLPVLVGGTMMYFNALKNGLSNLPKANKSIREELDKELKQNGLTSLHNRLKSLDPDLNIHPNDSQRVMRALEVCILLGKPMSEALCDRVEYLKGWDIKAFAVVPESRDILHARIAERLDKMFVDGLVKEVEDVVAKYNVDLSYPALRSVGYRQTYQHLLGEISLDDAKLRALYATRQLAKRQYTWLRAWQDITWIGSQDELNV